MLIDYSCVTNNTTLSHIGNEENLKLTMATSYGKLDEFDPALAKTGLNISSDWNTTSWLMELLLPISNVQY